MAETKCICGAVETTPFGEKNGGKVAACVECGLIRRVDYDPTAIVELYTEGDYYHNTLQREVGHDPYLDRFEHDRKIGDLRLVKLHENYRLLDVGCANGAFMEAAKEIGYSVYGVELNELMAEAAYQRTQRPVFTLWSQVRGGFDVITYHDVIEHVVDPQAEIDRAAEFLNDGGTLVLDTPDADHTDFATLGMEWHHIRPEQHLWFFRERDLSYLLLLANLEVVHVDRPIAGKLVVYARKGSVS